MTSNQRREVYPLAIRDVTVLLVTCLLSSLLIYSSYDLSQFILDQFPHLLRSYIRQEQLYFTLHHILHNS